MNLDGWGLGDVDLYEGMDLGAAIEQLSRARAAADPMSGFEREGDDRWAVDARTMLSAIWKANGVRDEDVDAWVDRSVVQRDDGTWAIRPDAMAYELFRHDGRIFEMLDGVRCPCLIVQATTVGDDEFSQARHRGATNRLSRVSQENANIDVVRVDGSDHNSLVSTYAGAVADAVRQFVEGRDDADWLELKGT